MGACLSRFLFWLGVHIHILPLTVKMSFVLVVLVVASMHVRLQWFLYANGTCNCWLHRPVPINLWLHFVEEITWRSRVKQSEALPQVLWQTVGSPRNISRYLCGGHCMGSIPANWCETDWTKVLITTSRHKTRYNPWPT